MNDKILYTLRKTEGNIQLWMKGKFSSDYIYSRTLSANNCFVILDVEKAVGNNDYLYYEILTSEGVFWTAIYSKVALEELQKEIL